MSSSITTCINNYDKLLNAEYVFLIGRKNKTCELTIHFDKNDFFHLAGLHYLADLGQLHGSRETLYDSILTGSIAPQVIEESIHYDSIKSRIDALSELPSLMESGKLVFRYNGSSSFFTKIIHDYLVEFTDKSPHRYLFLKEYADNFYHGISFFPKYEKDYTLGETRWTLLKVTRNTMDSGSTKSEVIYVSPSLK